MTGETILSETGLTTVQDLIQSMKFRAEERGQGHPVGVDCGIRRRSHTGGSGTSAGEIAQFQDHSPAAQLHRAGSRFRRALFRQPLLLGTAGKPIGQHQMFNNLANIPTQRISAGMGLDRLRRKPAQCQRIAPADALKGGIAPIADFLFFARQGLADSSFPVDANSLSAFLAALAFGPSGTAAR